MSFIEHLTQSSGWHRNRYAFLLGMLVTLTLPPFFLTPFLIPAFSGLFLLVSSAASRKRAFLDGWWWGWGCHMTGLYWFCNALLTDPEKFAWAIPFALFGITAIVALYPAFASLLAWFLGARKRHLASVFLFSVVWAVIEYARGHLFTGFPWNLTGYSMMFSDYVLQTASLIGAYGLTWLAVFLGALPVILLQGGDRKFNFSMVGIAYALFIVAVGWGVWRLEQADRIWFYDRYVNGVQLRLVQANIPLGLAPHAQLQEYLALTQTAGLERITHVIWSETSLSYTLTNASKISMLKEILPSNTVLITGTLRVEGEGTGQRIWNSIAAIQQDGAIVNFYDKASLVPFGEFIPFRQFIPSGLQLPVGDRDFSAGAGPQTLQWPGLPLVSPLICYEGIFPGRVVDKNKQPQFLLNLTNDVWFGISTEPYQHFHMTRMRAVEQGLPLVRVANTGISAVTDRFGRIISSLPLNTRGVIDSRLPIASGMPTFYALHGEWFLLLLILGGVGLIIWQQKIAKN